MRLSFWQFNISPISPKHYSQNTPTYEIPKRIEFHEKDILNRRHFGGEAVPLGRMLKKGIMSLEGMEGSWLKDRSGSFSQKDQCVIVVDCFSTGAMVAHEALEQGFKVIRIGKTLRGAKRRGCGARDSSH